MQADRPTVESVNRLLPQTQCTRCGYEGCLPYAQALVEDRADLNRCPPGGERVIQDLADHLGRKPMRLNPDCGEEGPRRVARIDPQRCIGCVQCLLVCPVDAIAGAPKRLHAVIEPYCSGCDLCVPRCPVDCIEMVVGEGALSVWTPQDAEAARLRHHRRARRLATAQSGTRGDNPTRAPEAAADGTRKQAILQAAILRARERAQAGDRALPAKRGAGS